MSERLDRTVDSGRVSQQVPLTEQNVAFGRARVAALSHSELNASSDGVLSLQHGSREWMTHLAANISNTSRDLDATIDLGPTDPTPVESRWHDLWTIQ